MPTPEKIKFYEANKDEMNTLVIKENSRRSATKEKLLTEDDIDEALDDIMDLVSSGGKISDFKFKGGVSVAKANVTVNGSIDSKDNDPSAINFSIARCQNGFLLKSSDDKFIFKTQRDLLKIISGIIELGKEKTHGNADKIQA